MKKQNITCPACRHEFILTDAIQNDIENDFRKKFEIEKAEFYEKETAALEKKAREKEAEKFSLEMTAMKETILDKEKLLEESRAAQLSLLKRERELEEKQKNLELSVEAQRKKIQEEAEIKAAESNRMKFADQEKVMSDMRKQIEELKRKSETNSAELQGSVQEIEIASQLQSMFPGDTVERVGKGKTGGDVLLTVFTASRQEAGRILVESKRTKTWGGEWIEKTKDDMRNAQCEFGIIVSETLPRDMKHAGFVDGVWVTDFTVFPVIASTLRANLVQLHQARSALSGKDQKMELLYSYLSSLPFRQKMTNIAEKFASMMENHNKEKRAMQLIWARREKEITTVMELTASMYGDLQGLMGSALPELEILSLPAG